MLDLYRQTVNELLVAMEGVRRRDEEIKKLKAQLDESQALLASECEAHLALNRKLEEVQTELKAVNDVRRDERFDNVEKIQKLNLLIDDLRGRVKTWCCWFDEVDPKITKLVACWNKHNKRKMSYCNGKLMEKI